jgi:hypothetical protein
VQLVAPNRRTNVTQFLTFPPAENGMLCAVQQFQQSHRESPMQSSENGADTPLFVLVTRLYVHYRFKTRKTFNPQATLIDDDYAREVLALVRSVNDPNLQEMAAAYEAARFHGKLPPAPAKAAANPGKEEPMLDFPIEEPT